jgi:site-specific DNA recombinase
MSAASRKGKWVGGCPVLGYDVDPAGGRLIVNEEEAKRVRAIFALFEKHRSALPTPAEADARVRSSHLQPSCGFEHYEFYTL